MENKLEFILKILALCSIIWVLSIIIYQEHSSKQEKIQCQTNCSNLGYNSDLKVFRLYNYKTQCI